MTIVCGQHRDYFGICLWIYKTAFIKVDQVVGVSSEYLEKKMALSRCLQENCTFKRALNWQEIQDERLRVVFKSLDCDDLFLCENHATFHICKKQPLRMDCILDYSGTKCLVSGRMKAQEKQPPSSELIHNHKAANSHVIKETDDKYTMYKFASYILDYLQKKDIHVDNKRLNSMIQRLFVLFSQAKDLDVHKFHFNNSKILENSDTRMEYVLKVLEQELKQKNHYCNNDNGFLFRTQTGLLISHDLSCEENDLMPFESGLNEAPYVTKRRAQLKDGCNIGARIS